jgi:hypothetical protein
VFAPSIAAAGAAEPVWLDGAVRLCARRVPAQPPARLCEGGAGAGVSNGQIIGATSCPTA